MSAPNPNNANANAAAKAKAAANAANAAAKAAMGNGASQQSAAVIGEAAGTEIMKGNGGNAAAAAAKAAALASGMPPAGSEAVEKEVVKTSVVAGAAAGAATAAGASPPVAAAVGAAAGQEMAAGNGKNAGNAAAKTAAANGMPPAAANNVGNATNAAVTSVAQFPGPPAAPNAAGQNFQGVPASNRGTSYAPTGDALVDPQARPADGRLGSYVPADTYLHGVTLESGDLTANLMSRPRLGAACAESDRGCTLFRGPADAANARPVASLFPLALESGDGFDKVLVDAPMDLLYADQLMGEDVNVLTTTRNQSRDLRGEPAIAGMYTLDKFGVSEGGSAGGAYLPDLGPYQLRKPVRQFIA